MYRLNLSESYIKSHQISDGKIIYIFFIHPLKQGVLGAQKNRLVEYEIIRVPPSLHPD